jgi:predicted 2-oxoglutarate/Fe(II)-dependent dioxygenase YbiX/peroxiredoxin
MLKRFPASEQGPLTVGERLHNLTFLDHKDRPFSLYHDRVYGWPKAIVLAASPEDVVPELEGFARVHQALGRTETQILAITRAPANVNAAVAERLKLPFLVLSDPEGALHRAAGLDDTGAAVTLLFDSILRLERKITASNGARLAEAALKHAQARLKLQQRSIVTAQAPILAVPNVLDRDHCRRLIAYWEQGQKFDNSVASSKVLTNRASAKTKMRADVILPEDSSESQELIEAIRRRLLPEVLKGFGFRVSRMEHFRVGCYDSASGGYFAPHRDNTTPLTKHRRYAITLNLNTGEYEGGLLRFPEYGPQFYAPPAGGAVVFHCSLLHFALPVTRGRRFVIVGFFWGEEEHKIYEDIHAGRTLEQSLPG